MRFSFVHALRPMIVALLIMLVGCGNDSSNDDAAEYDYYVDALNGADANPGTRDLPFSTISHAINVADKKAAIRVFPGLYDQSHGEDAAIQLYSGLELIGDETNLGLGTPPTQLESSVQIGDGSVIAGFSIVTPGTEAVRIRDAATIRNNTITNAIIAIQAELSGQDATIVGNVITNNDFGLWLVSAGEIFIEDNEITANQTVGVFVYETDVDAGGGPLGSTGGNLIYCNGAWDISAQKASSGEKTVHAISNFWDHPDPLNIDAFTNTGVTFVIEDVSVAPNNCP
jgi:parallel beta-helix repeat protein